jgi:hypothetical protein
VVVFITTHTDPDRGDLWLGHDEDNEICAVAIDDVIILLFYYFISEINYILNSGSILS